MSEKKRLFLLGDSISIHYAPYLKLFLAGFYTCKHKAGDLDALRNLDIPAGANGGDSGMVLNYLRSTPSVFPCDTFLFNCGLHDIKRDVIRNELAVPPSEYTKNLEAVTALVKEKGANPVWINTTPVDDERHARLCAGFVRKNADAENYNALASEVMQRADVPQIDLYSLTLALGGGVWLDHVHFTESVRQTQAAYIAGALRAME